MTEADSEPDLPKVAGRLGLIFAAQVVAMIVIVIGAILLMVTLAHNNSPSCDPTFGFAATGGCHHRSYALPIGLLAGGFGVFMAGMAVSAWIGMRAGATVLSSLLPRRRP